MALTPHHSHIPISYPQEPYAIAIPYAIALTLDIALQIDIPLDIAIAILLQNSSLLYP